MGRIYFSDNETCIPWMPLIPYTIFFGFRMPENLTRKTGLDICEQSLCWVFDSRKNLRSRLSLHCKKIVNSTNKICWGAQTIVTNTFFVKMTKIIN